MALGSTCRARGPRRFAVAPQQPRRPCLAAPARLLLLGRRRHPELLAPPRTPPAVALSWLVEVLEYSGVPKLPCELRAEAPPPVALLGRPTDSGLTKYGPMKVVAPDTRTSGTAARGEGCPARLPVWFAAPLAQRSEAALRRCPPWKACPPLALPPPPTRLRPQFAASHSASHSTAADSAADTALLLGRAQRRPAQQQQAGQPPGSPRSARISPVSVHVAHLSCSRSWDLRILHDSIGLRVLHGLNR